MLRDCDVKPLVQIAHEARDLAERARAGRLRASEMSGATFSISNLGMFDVEEFSAIINPPEGAILAVGSILEKPVVVDGELAVGRRMKMTISCDHRAMDGAMGAASCRTSSACSKSRSGSCCRDGDLAMAAAQKFDVRGHRHRPRRLCRRHPRRPARAIRRGGRGRPARRRLPQLGLHPDQGPPAQRGSGEPLLARGGVRHHGGRVEGATMPRPSQRSRRVADRMAKGVEFLFRKNKITLFLGPGRSRRKNVVEVAGKDGVQTLEAGRAVILATGSEPRSLPGVTIDEKTVISSNGAVRNEGRPASLVVIGAGAVGMEFADVYARLRHSGHRARGIAASASHRGRGRLHPDRPPLRPPGHHHPHRRAREVA